MATNPTDIRHYYSLDEYFALEHAGDARYEYWNGDIVCMSGGTRAHGRISGNIHYRLAHAVEGTLCEAFTADTAIFTPAIPPYRYPDASVACDVSEYRNVNGVDALANPVLIVEVLSPSTAVRDHEAKFAAYQAIPTFREYLLVAQDEPRVIHYWREGHELWQRQNIAGLDATIALRSIDCTLRMNELYQGVAFPV